MGNAMGEHKHKQRIVPREQTPAPGGTPTTHAGGGLPDDLLNEQVQTARSVQSPGCGALDDWSGDGLRAAADDADRLFAGANLEVPGHRSGRHHHVWADLLVFEVRPPFFIRQDECEPGLHAAVCRADRGDEYVDFTAAAQSGRSSRYRGWRFCCSCIR